MYCNNCGKQGHISRNCEQPITSYGVLLFTDEEIPKITMIKRKDSLCYIELLRGKYDIYNSEKIKLLLDRISKVEIQNIKEKDFDTLWKNLWLIDDIKHTKYMKEYTNSKNMFDLLKMDEDIKEYLKNIDSKYDCTEWEFPKGKKNINTNEKNYECAKRELCEETNIQPEDYDLIENISPISENFVGENNVNYRNIYYIGICKNTNNIILDKNNHEQLCEISDVQLFTEEEAYKHIRDYNTTKNELIKLVFNFIKKYKTDLMIK